MTRKGSFIALAVALAAALLPLRGAVAQDAALEVRLGAGLGRTVPAFTARPFAPEIDGVPTVQIHSGDVVTLDCCAILLPDGTDPSAWRDANQVASGAPYAPIVADPDGDVPGFSAAVKVSTFAFSPSRFDCGPPEDPCDFDINGDDVLNAGDSGPMSVRLTGNPNSTATVVPQIPREGADLVIEIVPANAATTTQAQLDEARSEMRAADRARALELMEELNKVNRVEEDGHWVYEVFAGYDEGPISLMAFFPQQLRVPRGSVVRYSFEHAISEPHTTTFPAGKAGKVSDRSFFPACDPDGTGDGPDTPGEFGESGPECPGDSEFEFDLARRMTAEIGDGTFPAPRRSYENSGLRGELLPTDIEGLAGGTEPWDVLFNKSSRKAYGYICVFHGHFMGGSVKVR